MEQQPSLEERHGSRHRRGRGRGQRPTAARGRAHQSSDLPQGASANDEQQSSGRSHRHRHRNQPLDEPASSINVGVTPSPSHTPARPSRYARFRATLTDSSAQASSSSSAQPPAETCKPKPPPRRAREPPGDDLTSTLTHALRTPPFPDCPICFSPIRPEQSTWSCSPPTGSTTEERVPDVGGERDKDEESQCCWSTFHLKCIRAWADKSVKELEEAWQARGESRPGEWHCPGCRATRQAVPDVYMCFCLRVRRPAPPRIATPHSCAQPCSRPRPGCKHACLLPCHPGPCPPCAVTIKTACFCGKEKRSAKCHIGLAALSCTQPCLKPLQCDNMEHLCAESCHEGPCPPCDHQADIRCWCGRQTKSIACGQVKLAEGTQCVLFKDDGTKEIWTGSYSCDHPCERPFACLLHSCPKSCHPPSATPPPCPFDPERVISCACGRCRIARSSDELAATKTPGSLVLLPPRTSCTSPLPTCTSPCSKPLPCGHLCQVTCHWDPCPPCTEQVERTCRCGATRRKTPCSGAVLLQPVDIDTATPASKVIVCDKPCQALRSCGRHQCGRICCPLASLQRVAVRSGKKPHNSRVNLDALLLDFDPTVRALHDCDLPCGRILSCGNHFCPRRDHKGPCDVCPRGVFDELVCFCGRTVLEPPIQCGTRLRCMYPCARPPPACGHPHVQHACHEGVVVAGADAADEGLGLTGEGESGRPCPPCPFLTEKVCACGKKRVGNVRCSQERVSCGAVCGQLLSCGFHSCERLCHADACGSCIAVCGKPRKSCLPAHHPCTQTCHAPAACPETEPCLTPVVLTCPCGNLRSTIPCSGTKLTLACNGECEIKKRNARLAEALGISEEKREGKGKVTWSVDLVSVARGLGPKFVATAEKTFADFIASDRHVQVLPHMTPERRKFVHDLASVYRMDTVMVDQEPHRSVQLIRRIDTRVPTPLLSQTVASMGLKEGTGKLVDLRLVGKGSVSKGASTWSGGNDGSSGIGTGTSSGVGVSGSGSVGIGTGRWSTVAQAALGAPRSGSATPPVGAPSTTPVVSREGSPGRSRLPGVEFPSSSANGGTVDPVGPGAGRGKKSVWVSPSVQALREREGAEVASGRAIGENLGQAVPDDWEDEA